MNGIINSLYWKLHTSYLKNIQDVAKLFLSTLEAYDKKSIENSIGPIHFKRYQYIKNNIQNGNFSRLLTTNNSSQIINNTCNNAQENNDERLFCKNLYTQAGFDKLRDILNFSEKSSFISEYNLKPYGIIDLFLYGERKVFGIEVKMGQAPNSVVSQIDRYRLALELDMCTGLYDEVVMVLMAESFTTYEAIELARNNVVMLEHTGTLESIRKI